MAEPSEYHVVSLLMGDPKQTRYENSINNSAVLYAESVAWFNIARNASCVLLSCGVGEFVASHTRGATSENSHVFSGERRCSELKVTTCL